MAISVDDYLTGAIFALPVLAAAVAAGYLTVIRRAAAAPRWPAVFVVASAALVLAHLLPGLVGLLSREAVLVTSLVLAGGAALLRERAAGPAPPPPPTDPQPPWAWALAVGGTALTAVGGLAFLFERSTHLVTAVDALTTHLPTVARWSQEGHYWQLVQYAPDLSNATYPHHGTLLLLASVLPWDSTFAVRYVGVPFLVAAAGALYAIAREIGAPRPGAMLAGTSLVALAAVNEPALEQAQVDAPMLAWFALGVLFLVRVARGAGTAELVLAGIALGLAFGTKWYAVVYVPVVVMAFGLAVRRWWPVVGLAGLVGVTGGVWMVRNWVEAGNPLHPAEVAVGGLTVFDAPRDSLREYAGFTVSDYLFDARVWREYLAPSYWENFGLLGPVLLTATVVAAVIALRRGTRGIALMAATTLVLAMLYSLLPDTAFGPPGQPVLVGANSRYLVPALMGGAVLAGWLGRAATPFLAAGVVVGVIQSFATVGLGDIQRAVALIAVVASAAWLLRKHASLRLAAAAVAVALMAIGWELSSRAAGERYAELDPAAAALAQVPTGGRVALGGIWDLKGISPVLPAFGERLENRVDYLGRFVDGTLRQWQRPEPFQAQLADGNYDLVVLGKGLPATPQGAQPHVTWARAEGYRVIEDTPRFVVLAR